MVEHLPTMTTPSMIRMKKIYALACVHMHEHMHTHTHICIKKMEKLKVLKTKNSASEAGCGGSCL